MTERTQESPPQKRASQTRPRREETDPGRIRRPKRPTLADEDGPSGKFRFPRV